MLLTGCSKEPTSYSLTPENIRSVVDGESRSLTEPEPEQLFEACQIDEFCSNLKELELSRGLSKYNSPAVSRLANLEKVQLYVTSNTDEFIDVIPKNLKTLVLIQTDLSSDGIARIRRLASLESLHLSPWQDDSTEAIFETIRKLNNLKEFGVEWIDDGVVDRLRAEFPDIKIIEHTPGG